MAELTSNASGEVIPLPARALIGRSPVCYLRLEVPHVSSEHAVLRYEQEGWWVKDLGSRNGTFVGGERIGAGESRALHSGDAIAFGSVAEEVWVLSDEAAPGAVALGLTTRRTSASDGILALPNDSDPQASLYLRSNGRWVLETPDSGQVEVVDQSDVEVDGERWVVFLPGSSEATPALQGGVNVALAELHFKVSRNEEHVELELSQSGHTLDLGFREHHYLLLVLARARLEEADMPEAERGWVDRDELLKMLAFDSGALGVAIHRARRQLAKAGVLDAADIVQVRPRQRRLGSDTIRITRT